MSDTPELSPLFSPQDEALMRDLMGATEKTSKNAERMLLATMASNIVSGISANSPDEYLDALGRKAVRLAKNILKEIDDGE